MHKCLIGDFLTSEGQKLHPQNILTQLFSEHASHEEACTLVAPAQNDNYLTFFLSPIIFPHALGHPASFSHKYPKALAFQEADLRLVIPSLCLAVLEINPPSAANLDVSG